MSVLIMLSYLYLCLCYLLRIAYQGFFYPVFLCLLHDCATHVPYTLLTSLLMNLLAPADAPPRPC
jgi:hypothetical protein